jgi:hypothetical protein
MLTFQIAACVFMALFFGPALTVRGYARQS